MFLFGLLVLDSLWFLGQYVIVVGLFGCRVGGCI